MATMKMSGCMALVSRMSQSDQDALLARLDQYQADGIPAERAQIMAASDMLAEVDAERSQIFQALAEQFPDLLTVEEEGDVVSTDPGAGDEAPFDAAKYGFQASARQTDTAEFKQWFGDSVVTDDAGAPLVLYTGTSKDKDFDKFNVPKNGTWFTTDPAEASMYAKENDSRDIKYNSDTRQYEEVNTASRVMPVYVRIEKPATLSAPDMEAMRMAGNYKKVQGQIFDRLRAEGYDGVDLGGGVWVVIGNANQIKSAIGNSGAFDPANPDIRYSKRRNELGFYSALADSIDGIKTNTAPAQGWKDAIKGLVNKGAVKADEVEWSGINDWLDLQQGKVSKEQVAEYLKAGGVQVEETVLGRDGKPNNDEWEPDDGLVGNTRYGNYTLPGGTNYREVLLTLPLTQKNAAGLAESERLNEEAAKLDRQAMAAWTDRGDRDEFMRLNEQARELRRQATAAEKAGGTESYKYKSIHWDQANVIAHIRVNDRTDADGNKVLFVEEIQSDWGQEAKKKGFSRSDDKQRLAELVRKSEELSAERKAVRQEIASLPEGSDRLAELQDRADAILQERGNIAQQITNLNSKGVNAIPPGPFVTKTEGWLNLALKRIVTMAAEGGYDKVAFVNGAQSADRYDLSKQIDYIEYEQTDPGKYYIRATDRRGGRPLTEYQQTPEQLEALVGKEIAQKIVDGKGEKGDDGNTILRTQDLKVGGEGMKAFYDTIVPTAVKKLLPKVGGGQMSTVSLTSRSDEVISRDTRFTFYIEGAAVTLEQPGFDVTDAMREKVAEGLPLFSRRRNIFGQTVSQPGQPLANWTQPTDTKLDNVIYVMQDKMVDTKRVVESIKAAVGNLDDRWNAYLQEELYHGRTAKATKDFLSDELRPLLQEMQQRGVDVAEFEEYLHNRHAEERNVQIAKVNAAYPNNGTPGSGGSGIDTADARAYLAALSQGKRNDLEALARRVDAITAGTRQMLVASGLETQDTINAWEQAYSKYVPLQREDLDFSAQMTGAGTGQGYQVRGPSSKRATGSTRSVVDILANVAMQRERAIVRAEKARVATAVYGMAVQYPNTDFWLAVDPAGQKDPVKAQADLVRMGINPLDAKNIIEEPTQPFTDPNTGLVSYRVNPLLRSSPNVLAVRVNGEEKYVFFNANDERSQRMVGALKNLDADQLGRVMSISAMVTRYFASINTQYNPIFGAINFMRDVQGATLNLTTTPIADKKAQVMGDTMLALRGIYSDLRSRRAGNGPATGTWATLWEEFQREGGQTGFRDQFSKSAERAEALETELKRISEGKVKQAGRAIFDWLSDYNETMENAVRLAAYKAAKDKGLSVQQAASVAKNLTVNFNRKGQVATQAGALFAFFNASVQGTTRLAETLTGPAGRKIVAGGLLLGVVQAMALAAAGFDDDEPPGFAKERNLIIPTGDGKYLQIPMPLGFNVIPNTTRVLTEWALSGWRDPAKRLGEISGAFMEMFNPIGNAGWSLQTLMPTAVDPLVALRENQDWTGKPIARLDRSDLNPTPGYTRAKETASWFSKQLSYYLNLATGGTKYKPGGISPTPDQIDYLIGQVTGGVGREVMKIEQTITSSVTGEELPPYKVPLAGRFYGDTKAGSAESNRFYENLKRLNEHEAEIKGRQKNRDGGVEQYRRENPESRLISYANQVERDVQELRKKRRELVDKDADPARVKLYEERIKMRMKQLNDRVKTARDGS